MQHYTVYLYLETALHVSGGTSTHHQERIQLYLQYLVFATPLLLSAAIVEELGLVWVSCGWHMPLTALGMWSSSQLLLRPYQIPRQSGYSPVLHPNGASLPHIVTGPSRNCPARTRIILQRFPAFLKMCEPSKDLCTTQSSSSHIFQVLLHFHDSFSRFTVKFNHGILLHVESFDIFNNHTLTLTVIKGQLLMPQRWACGHWDKHILAVRTIYYFANLFAGNSEKKISLIIYRAHCVYMVIYLTMHCNTKHCINIHKSYDEAWSQNITNVFRTMKDSSIKFYKQSFMFSAQCNIKYNALCLGAVWKVPTCSSVWYTSDYGTCSICLTIVQSGVLNDLINIWEKVFPALVLLLSEILPDTLKIHWTGYNFMVVGDGLWQKKKFSTHSKTTHTGG